MTATPQPDPVPVPRKLLAEAHACMRACGWHLAPDDDDAPDPVLALAVADIERRIADLLGADLLPPADKA